MNLIALTAVVGGGVCRCVNYGVEEVKNLFEARDKGFAIVVGDGLRARDGLMAGS